MKQIKLDLEMEREAIETLNVTDRDDQSALDAIDRAEDQIARGQVQEWKDVREQVRAKFLGK